MKKYLLALAASAFTFVVSAAPLTTKGSIYSIFPDNEDDRGRTYEAGETVKFTVRLLAYNGDAAGTPVAWKLSYVAHGSSIYDDIYNPPMLGVVVSGKLVGAQIKNVTTSSIGSGGVPFTDLHCEYTVKSGDFALPMNLALADSTGSKPKVPGSEAASKTEYFLFNSDKWAFTAEIGDDGAVAGFYYCTQQAATFASNMWKTSTPAIGSATDGRDYSLSKCNFKIKTIDFNSSKYSVAKTTTVTGQIVTSGPALEEPQTFYVWAKKQDAAEMAGDAAYDPELDRMVATVTIHAGQTASDPFSIKGLDNTKAGETLVLSPTRGYRYDAAGDMLTTYLEVPVECTAEPQPNIQLSFKKDDPFGAKELDLATPMLSNGKIAPTPVYITLSKAYESDMTLDLNVVRNSEDHGDPTAAEYMNIWIGDQDGLKGTFDPADSIKTVKITAGATTATVYVYALRGTTDTAVEGITLKLSSTDAAVNAFYNGGISAPATILLSDEHKPVISEPVAAEGEDAYDCGVVEVTGFELPIKLNDCYCDLKKGTYTVKVSYSNSKSMTLEKVSFATGKATIKVKDFGALEGPRTATIRISETDNESSWAETKIKFDVKAARAVRAEFYDGSTTDTLHDGTTFSEGAMPYIRFTISEAVASGEPRYAFLVPANEETKALVDMNTLKKGAKIEAGQVVSELKTRVNFLDGDTELAFRVVLATSATLNDDADDKDNYNVDESYASTDIELTVENVPATITDVMVADESVPAGKTREFPIACGVPVDFAVNAADVLADLDPTAAEDRLVAIWSYTDDERHQTYKYLIAQADQDGLAESQLTFKTPNSLQNVNVMVLDKDTLAANGLSVAALESASNAKKKTIINSLKNKGIAEYSIVVPVGTAPVLTLIPVDFVGGNTILENDTTGFIRVKLSDIVDRDVAVTITAKSNVTNKGGDFAFADPDGDPNGVKTISLVIPAGSSEPEVKGVYTSKGLKINYATLDGTAASASEGWTLTPSTTDTYFTAVAETIYIANAAPKINPPEPANLTTNQVSVGEIVNFTWNVKDVAADNGNLIVKWYVNDVYQSDKDSTITADKVGIDQTTELVFSEPGFKDVRIEVTDKDGADAEGVASRRWYYMVPLTKQFQLTAIGPSKNTRTKYRSAKGLGAGRTAANNASGTAQGFTQTYNYSVSTGDAVAYAFGYKPGESETGVFSDPSIKGVRVDASGNTTKGDAYTYNGEYSTFFYRWAIYEIGNTASEPTFLIPEPTLSPSEMKRTTIALDKQEKDKESYNTAIVEAIFSREYRAGDGVGDINADGIPDIVVQDTALGGSALGTMPEDDFADLSTENIDGDALPETGRNLFSSTIPGMKDSWLQGLNVFTAKMEIRGVHEGLNDALVKLGIPGATYDGATAKRDYSPAEWRAYLASGKDPKWSPENPTDPTLEDTDNDGFPDGYEYYYWYWAHVGKINDHNNWARLTGEKYNPVHPAQGIVMTPDEIEKIVNPTVPYAGNILDKDSVDSDGDGLPDLLEFDLGTNPFHWDTDGDGMPDGWEVRQSNTNPLAYDSGANADGDYMAAILVTDMQVVGTLNEDGTVKYYVAPSIATEGGDQKGAWIFVRGDKRYALIVEDGEDETSFENYFSEQNYQDGNEIITYYYLKEQYPISKLVRFENDKRGPGVQLVKGTELISRPFFGTLTESVLAQELSSAVPFTERAYEAFRYGTVIETVNNVDYSVYTVAKDIAGTVPAGTIVVRDTLPNRIYFMHHQVYQRRGFYFPEGDEALNMVGGGLVLKKDMGTGFNPLTAWMIGAQGKVGSRYHDPNKPEADPASFTVNKSGTAVDTKAYTAVDEFLVMFFHNACGMLSDDQLKPYSPAHNSWSISDVWNAYTTKAGIPTAKDGTAQEQGPAADSDGDGCPDGWELYISCGPGGAYSTDPNLSNHFKNELRFSPRDNGNNDCAGPGGDVNIDPITGKKTPDMLPVREFSATDTALAYPNTPSVQANKNSTWINKFFPTDPWSSDTDGDGLKDSEEAEFIYGSADYNDVRTDDGTSFCIPGGGLNPCSWDTDFDGLPDPWEVQFKGAYITPKEAALDLSTLVRRDYERRVAAEASQAPKHALGCYLCGGMDGTVADSYTNGEYSNQLLNVNRDYDYDGLDPWQEYLTGLIRVFRYDDVLSPWSVMHAPAINEELERIVFTEGELNEYMRDGAPINPLYAIGGHADQVEMTGGSNPNLVFGKFDVWGAYGSFCRRDWDQVSGHWYYFPDGPNHCLKKFNNAYQRRIAVDLYATVDGVLDNLVNDDLRSEGLFKIAMSDPDIKVKQFEAPTKYATTDPRNHDSDGDGMDDYYELFHGLNPLYGGSTGDDLVAKAWNHSIKATKNYWTEKYPEADVYDFVKFPWMTGDPAADPDGDDIRNIEEAIQANAQAPSTWLHTDPTPLWMTDPSSSNSFVTTSYRWVTAGDQLASVTNGVSPIFHTPYAAPYLPEGALEPLMMESHFWNVPSGSYNFSFESNEGYDTDHDGINDYQETSSAAAGQTDPTDFDDPHRRQAMYFPGAQSVLQAQVDPHFMVNANSSLNFLTFTVECWVRPEQISKMGGQVILERAVLTSGSNPEDKKLLRRNFELGLDDSGRYYAAFDHNGTGVARITAKTSTPATKTWAHLAATYDGTSLNLYVNGKLMVNTPTTLHPATPAVTIKTEVGYEYYEGSQTWDNDLHHTREKLVDANAIIFGADAYAESALNLNTATFGGVGETPSYYRYYKGYLDEVRIWDGARTAAEIEDNYNRRFGQEDLLANRQAVYAAFVEGATRSINHEGVSELPPELAYHYNFSGLFAGVEPEDVAKVPFGFNAPRAKAVRPEGWETPWWANLAVRSTVYTAKDFIPWIPNGIAHLPRFNGTTDDSVYWSDDYAGFTAAEDMGFEKMTFPHTHELYPMRTEVAPLLIVQSTRTTVLAGLTSGLTTEQKQINAFTQHNAAIDGTELLPLGGAYVKYCDDFWDDQGPTTTWEIIGTDENNNGIGDWWEEHNIAYKGVSPSDGDKYSAALEAYRRDIAGGAYPAVITPVEIYKQIADENRNGLPDWWEQLYSLTGVSGTDDFDNDGLSNYTEYLLGEVFKLGKFNPRNAFSVDSSKLDYFTKIGELYAGEIFTDHDLVNDAWERNWDESKVSAHSFDAYSDGDGDGWSNYAEFRVGTDPTKGEASSIVDNEGNCYTRVEYPVPMIHANVRYNGKAAPIGKVVFQAWNKATDADMTGAPDAVWTVGGESEAGEASSAHEKFVGRKPTGTQTINLTGGSVDEGSVKILFLDKGYNVITVNTLTDRIVGIENGEPDKASWYYRIYDSDGKLVMIGNSLYGDSAETTVGTINYTTGEVTIDFDHEVMVGAMFGNRTEQTSGENLKTYDYLDLNNSYVLVKWNSTKVRTTVAGDYYLADADVPSADASSRGYIREGKNSFVCFVDSDEDGKYTPGELFGFVDDVDVGWAGATVNVLLSETHPVFARLDVYSGKTDREYWYGTESGNRPTSGGIIPGDKKVRVRVFRTLVNGIGIGRTIDPNDNTPTGRLNLDNECVLDKLMDLDERNYLHEGDFIGAGQLDLEWNTLYKGVIKAEEVTSHHIDVTNMTYRIVLGNGDVSPDTTNNIVAVAISRSFDGDDFRKRALPTDIGRVEAARPTLRWTMEGGAYNSYPVFQVKVYEGETEIYDSGERSISELTIDSNNAYSWQLPICVGDQIPGKTHVFENGKTYTYTVAMLNSKFRKDEDKDKNGVSELKKRAGAFRTNVPSSNGACGAASFNVRYFGPTNSFLKAEGPVRLQAFASPDFTGTPIGAAVVDSKKLTGSDTNVMVIGLPAGTCYFLAFIDADDDGKCSDWETKGWYSTRAAATDVMIAPKAVNMSANVGITGTIYLEDADTDHDGIPDGYEYAMFKSLSAKGSSYIDESSEAMKNAGVTLYEGLRSELEKNIGRAAPTARTAMMVMNTLSNANVASLILGLEPTGNGSFALPAPAVLDNGLAITGMSIDPTTGAVNLTVTAEAEAGTASTIYESASSATVKLVIEHSSDLVTWQQSEPITITITAGTTEETLSVTADDLKGKSSGFFRVTIGD